MDPSVLRPYVAGLVVDWLADTPSARHRSVEGTLAFVDISGFTSLTERLAQRGKAGAEEMSDLLDAIFAELLGVAYEHGSWLVKWGGDAVLLLFEGDDHAPRAATAAYLMNRTLARVGRLQTSAGAVRLRMSVGLHSGAFDFFLVGSLHHELVIAGPGATVTAQMEGTAEAGEVACSPATAALLPARTLGPTKDGAVLLARSPAVRSELVLRTRDLSTVDIGSCLPAPVRDHVLAGPLDGEHRQVAVAFVEFSGTDALLTEQGPGAAAAAIDHVVSTCQASAAQRGVTFWETDINKDGGKVMLIAGAPASSGGDEDAMLALARDVVDAGGVLDVRVGVNCGRVFSGGFGPPYRRTYSVTGDAINLAARLMARAPRGAVLASATVLSAAKTRYAEEALEPFLVKGKAKPIHASVVGAARHRRDVAAGEVARPLAGRETELHTLRAAAEAARQGAGSIVEIVGDAGIGKSRLVEELCVGLDVPVVSTACDAYHSTSPYAVVRALLQRVLDVDEDADAHRVGEVLAARTRKSAPSVLPWLPLVADVLGAAVPGTVESAALDPRRRVSLT